MQIPRLFLVFAAAGAMSACAPVYGPSPPPPGPPPSSDFRAQDFAWSTAQGAGRIEGRLVYRHRQARYTCAGAAVLLTPETPWSRRRMTILYNSADRAALPTAEVRARTPSAPSGDYSAFVRRTTCSSDDRFTFTGLPNGAWFAITVARPAGGAAGPEIAIMRRIEIRGGRAVVLDL